MHLIHLYLSEEFDETVRIIKKYYKTNFRV